MQNAENRTPLREGERRGRKQNFRVERASRREVWALRRRKREKTEENRRTMNFEQKAENGRKHANEKTFSPLLSPSLAAAVSMVRQLGSRSR